MSKPVLFLIVPRSVPVESGGTAIIVSRLLDNFKAEEFILLARAPYSKYKLNKKIDYRYYSIPTSYMRGQRMWRSIAVFIGFFMGIYIVSKHKPKFIIGVYPNESSLVLSSLLSFVTGRKQLVYLCDLYHENKKTVWGKWLSGLIQGSVFKRAEQIFALNKGMQKFYKKTYDLDTLLLPNTITKSIPNKVELPSHRAEAPFVICYSGSINRDRIDPFQTFIKALRKLKQLNIQVKILSPHDEEYLKKFDLLDDFVVCKFCKSLDELMQELQQSHLLYLPLTFRKDGSSEAQLSTCFGTKAYEYMLSCRPILVHSPANYFTYTFFEDSDTAFLLPLNSIEDVKEKIQSVVEEYNIRGPELVKNTLVQVRQFEGPAVANRLRNYLSSEESKNSLIH